MWSSFCSLQGTKQFQIINKIARKQVFDRKSTTYYTNDFIKVIKEAAEFKITEKVGKFAS